MHQSSEAAECGSLADARRGSRAPITRAPSLAASRRRWNPSCSSLITSRFYFFVLFACSAFAKNIPASPDGRFAIVAKLASDDFEHGTGQWTAELEKGGSVTAGGCVLDIDVPRGCSLWFRKPFSGPILITYEATAVKAGGPNDRVSDLNCFWMARDVRTPDDLFASHRSGKFADYDELRCYYVGLGGNYNTTTRFRRYVGRTGDRPLLPTQDLKAKEYLIEPNVSQQIALLAAGGTIEYYRDGRRLFAYDDPAPYTSGWFAFRTVWSHLRIRHFRVYRLEPRQGGPAEGIERAAKETER